MEDKQCLYIVTEFIFQLSLGIFQLMILIQFDFCIENGEKI